MINSSGRYVNLGSMCPQPQPFTPVGAVTSSAQYKDPATADPASIAAYSAGKYCDWREAGGRSREEARDHATSELTSYLFSVYGPDGASQIIDRLGSEITAQESAAIKRMCPGDA